MGGGAYIRGSFSGYGRVQQAHCSIGQTVSDICRSNSEVEGESCAEHGYTFITQKYFLVGGGGNLILASFCTSGLHGIFGSC